jgi:hypothetical protein
LLLELLSPSPSLGVAACLNSNLPAGANSGTHTEAPMISHRFFDGSPRVTVVS